ncbi:MAG: hypothetical protein ACFCVF_10690 [Kineosporiaceae bacterium]
MSDAPQPHWKMATRPRTPRRSRDEVEHGRLGRDDDTAERRGQQEEGGEDDDHDDQGQPLGREIGELGVASRRRRRGVPGRDLGNELVSLVDTPSHLMDRVGDGLPVNLAP